MALKLNETYPGRFNNPSAEYPQGSFKNRTTPTSEDGSYFEEQWANDQLAFLSSLLEGAGEVPNGLVDEVGDSQYYDALKAIIASNIPYAIDTGAANAYVATYAPALAALTTGQVARFKASNANTGASTFNPNGLGAKPIVSIGGAALVAGAISANSHVWLQYDATIGAGSWVSLLSAAQDTLNSAIATVAASGTINLTTGAPNTIQIAISGTGVSINGFTVAANRFFVVTMTGASNTLVNSASLVTGRGANIPVVAGDSFLMRSTAANTVEIVGGMFLLDRGLGSGQNLQIVTGSRALNTNYTNTTGRSIFVTVRVITTAPSIAANRIGIQLDGGAEYFSEGTPGAGASYILCAVGVIPAGAVYRANINNATLVDWTEMRT